MSPDRHCHALLAGVLAVLCTSGACRGPAPVKMAPQRQPALASAPPAATPPAATPPPPAPPAAPTAAPPTATPPAAAPPAAALPAAALPHRPGTPGLAAYSTPAVCFESEISVFQNRDYDDGGYRADLTFRYQNEAFRAGVSTGVGDVLAKPAHRVYRLCAVPITLGSNAKPTMYLIEIWKGKALLWDQSYDFPITQKLAWSPDHRELLVEFGRAMDDVFLTPFRGAGVVPVVAPDALRARPLRTDVDYTVQVRVHERRAGASVELIEVDEPTGGSWTPVWTSPTRAQRP